MKNNRLFVILFAVCLMVANCGGGDSSTENNPPPVREKWNFFDINDDYGSNEIYYVDEMNFNATIPNDLFGNWGWKNSNYYLATDATTNILEYLYVQDKVDKVQILTIADKKITLHFIIKIDETQRYQNADTDFNLIASRKEKFNNLEYTSYYLISDNKQYGLIFIPPRDIYQTNIITNRFIFPSNIMGISKTLRIIGYNTEKF